MRHAAWIAIAAAGAAGAAMLLAARGPGRPPPVAGDVPAAASPASLDAARKETVRAFWEAFRRAEGARLSNDRTRLAEAEAAYRESLGLDPDHENSLWGLANVLAAEGRVEEAVALLRRHVEAHPRSTRAYSRLGDLLGATGPGGDLGEAEAMFRKAVAMNPEESGGYVNLGRLLYRRGRIEEAEAAFRSALKINFKSLIAARYLARIALDRGDARAAAREIVPVLARALADKPRLSALSEGDTLEEAAGESLTPAAREVYPAALLVWLLVQAGGIPPDDVPRPILDLASAPLRPITPGSRLALPALRRSPAPAGGGAVPREVGPAPGPAAAHEENARRVLAADLDGDGVADRFSAGDADAAEAAAWILTGKVFCGDRAARFESDDRGGRIDGPAAAAPVEACLPPGDLLAADADGDGDLDVFLESRSEDPIRVEPEIALRVSRGRWTAALRSPPGR